MTKREWELHWEDVAGDATHAESTCPQCMARQSAIRRNERSRRTRRERDSIMRDCGLVKVRGAVSGRTYWE